MFNQTITLENTYESEMIVTKAVTSPNLDEFIDFPDSLNYVSIYLPRITESMVNCGVIRNLQYKDINFGEFAVVGMYLQNNIDKRCVYHKIELARFK